MIHFLAGFISGRNKKGANTLPPLRTHSPLTFAPVASVTSYVRSGRVCTESCFRYLPSVRRAYVRIYNPRSRHTCISRRVRHDEREGDSFKYSSAEKEGCWYIETVQLARSMREHSTYGQGWRTGMGMGEDEYMRGLIMQQVRGGGPSERPWK